MKRIFSIIICLFFVFNAVPTASAADILDDPLITPESVRLDKDGLPYIKDTPEINWIDRIDDLPSYAAAFYNWLVQESSLQENGALADLSKADQIRLSSGETAYAYTAVLTGEFFFDAVVEHNYIDTRDNIKESIEDKISLIMAHNCNTAVFCMMTALNAFDRDHPEVFWLDGEIRWGTDISVGNLRYYNEIGRASYTQRIYFILKSDDFDIRNEKYRDISVLTEAIASRDNAVSAIIGNMPAESTDSEKISYFNTVLTESNCYNTMSETSVLPNDSRECISALLGRWGEEGPVCEGYARAMKVLCDAAGIPCVLTDGSARYSPDKDEIMHIWNCVMVDGKWYAVDVTWNDPTVVGITTAVSGYESEKWLLVGSETVVNEMRFDESHMVHNQVMEPGVQFTNEPVIEKEGYQS